MTGYYFHKARIANVAFIVILFAEKNKGCPLAEEGKPYSFVSSFKHNFSDSVDCTWQKDGRPLSMCNHNLLCIDVLPTNTITTLKQTNRTVYAFNLTLSSVSRDDTALWSLRYMLPASEKWPYPLYTCNLLTYARGNNSICEETVQSDNLKISCTILNIYPQANGQLFITSSLSARIPRHMKCYHNVSASKPDYYTSRCETQIALRNINVTSDSLYVVMYPSLRNTEEDTKYGQNVKLQRFKSASILALHGCQEIIELGESIHCSCRPNDDSTIPTQIAWYDRSNSVLSIGNFKLSVTATAINEEYVCRGRTVVGVESVPVFYKPQYFKRGLNLTCEVKTYDTYLMINCSTSRIYPEGACFFTFRGEEFLSNGLRNIPGLPFVNEYMTLCNFTLSTITLSDGNYTIAVNVYPVITGTHRDRFYGTNYTITFHHKYVSSIQNMDARLDLAHGQVVLSISVSALVIVLIISFICVWKKLGYRKCVQSKQELHLQNSSSEYANVSSSQNNAPLDGLYSNSKVIAHRSLFQEVQNVHYREITSINYVTSDFVDNVSYITILD
ncbi:hypothetical protein BgiBS90_019182 [Biomphalaria glabrata]|nr:hypothetical protein BgiBS90_019182 [Biomphalaria glabrata]